MIITKNDITFKVEGHHCWFFETYVKETWEPHTWKILDRLEDIFGRIISIS